jgi:molecular chaperone GrpE
MSENETATPPENEDLDTRSATANLNAKIVRLQADFENFKKRTSRARSEAADDQKRELFTSLLPIYDNFQRALDQAEQLPELKPFLTGFEMIAMQFEQFFADQGFEQINAEPGTAFDPNQHEATGMLPPDSAEMDGTVAQVLQRGFQHKGFIVRPARVLVYGL